MIVQQQKVGTETLWKCIVEQRVGGGKWSQSSVEGLVFYVSLMLKLSRQLTSTLLADEHIKVKCNYRDSLIQQYFPNNLICSAKLSLAAGLEFILLYKLTLLRAQREFLRRNLSLYMRGGKSRKKFRKQNAARCRNAQATWQWQQKLIAQRFCIIKNAFKLYSNKTFKLFCLAHLRQRQSWRQ